MTEFYDSLTLQAKGRAKSLTLDEEQQAAPTAPDGQGRDGDGHQRRGALVPRLQ